MSTNHTTLASGERACEDNQLRTALLDSVTHEFRTPLTSIKAAVTALLTDARGTQLDDPAREPRVQESSPTAQPALGS
jgi:K+-sensing histidine kinase KdpD